MLAAMFAGARRAPLRLAAADGTIAVPADVLDAPLAVRGLTASYGTEPVVFSVDATFPAGTMTAIVGPNGAGKSTLLKAILGIVKPLAGAVHVFGEPQARARREIAYVPQRASVDWDFPTRAIDVVMMGLFRRTGLMRPVRREERERAVAALGRVGMADFADRQIGQLSGGQQQRVFLARALAQDTPILLLDEPFAGVDAATEQAIFGVLSELREEGRTIVVVHHDLGTVRERFDRVLLLNMRKIAEGRTSDVFTYENLGATYGGKLAAGQLIDLALATAV